MKEKQKKLFEGAGKHLLTFVVASFMLQIAVFVSGYIFFQGNLMLTLVPFLMTLGAFQFFKDFAPEDQKKIAFKLVKISILVFLCSSINCLFLEMANSLGSTSTKGETLFRLSYFVNIGLLVASVSFFRKEEVKTALQKLYDQSILEKLKILESKNDTNSEGDVLLCTDTKTKKSVILKHKDRFLHMLILGPTGCGKTSQMIIPMINQDMQNLNAGITVMEPKGDLAEKVYAMAEHYGRKAVYFNPILPNCPYFNPLYGKEEDVIENMATTFKMLNPDSPQFFLDMNETLIRNALKVLKRLYGNKATLNELSRLLHNSGGIGRTTVTRFSRLQTESAEMAKENADIASWFLNDYFNEKSKTYEHCSGLRSQVAKITSNKYLRRILNPPNGENDIDFDVIMEEGGVIAISTSQDKLRDLSRFLGYFLILQFQSAVFRRPGNENTRRPHFLYIDEFQVYSNPGFADMLTQGRSYRVASHLATQNRALIGMGSGQEGKDFVELVSTNARNLIIYPGGNAQDAKYYSEQFGEIKIKEVRKSTSRQKFNPLKGIKPLNYDSESVSEAEKVEARFTPSDIIYRPFGEVTYCLIRDNSIMPPGVGMIQYIPKELNDKLDTMVEEYKTSVFSKQVHADPPAYEQTDFEEVVQAEPVISKSVAGAQSKKSDKEFLYKGKDVVNPDEEFMDDFVISGGSNEPEDNKQRGFDFASDEEDDLI
ncbi:type IV secretory system conjugative DNA transfer family protein (plasmid) [Paenibacillus thiaminolyticus]|uniref:type IV secretory system conjugative DNA transfer family protein n=1 Tax=Paenibacillus thiaminolyticus TaxID=49283 RepID=UPI00232DBBD9|nr:type IV secretory system conjugative DNA transfer family protein [Paenibacillus thiaminolyticus]WCF11746.1 type IV secretory system conjugative DNA transfer family protein [Paenibacillus thiaminolyticus]